jgi:Mg2+ and Co2+ transporter CorA
LGRLSIVGGQVEWKGECFQSTLVESDDEDDEETTLRNLVKLVTDLKETIVKQNTIIENNQAELVEIKEEQQAIRGQNTQLQDEIRTVRGQLSALSASLSSTRSWASVVLVPVRPNSQPVSPRRRVTMGSRKNQTACGVRGAAYKPHS